MTEAPRTIDIEKNSKETLRLALDEYKGHKLLSMRVWYRGADDELHPSKSGFAVRLPMVEDVKAALDYLQATAKREGLL